MTPDLLAPLSAALEDIWAQIQELVLWVQAGDSWAGMLHLSAGLRRRAQPGTP